MHLRVHERGLDQGVSRIGVPAGWDNGFMILSKL